MSGRLRSESPAEFVGIRMRHGRASTSRPCGLGLVWYTGRMSKALKEIVERLQTWPEERQEDAARVLMAMEEQDNSPYRPGLR
jgi:hypothetical protein